MKKKNFLVITLLVTLLLTTLTGCGSAAYDSKTAEVPMSTRAMAYDTAENGYYAEPEASFNEEYIGETTTAVTPGEGNDISVQVNDSARKLIHRYNLDVETENFDDLLGAIDAKVGQLGGYVENLNTYNGNTYYTKDSRYSNMTIRIPSNVATEFIELVGNTANITNQSMSVEDITLDYVDMESRKDAYLIEQERLLSFLEKAETIEDIITIESRLSEVRYQLESMESQLRTYDNLVDYSTISLYVVEVQRYTEPEPEGYGETLLREFVDSLRDIWEGLKDLVIGFVAVLPKLVVFGVFVLAIFLIVSGIIKGSKKKKKNKAETLAKNNE